MCHAETTSTSLGENDEYFTDVIHIALYHHFDSNNELEIHINHIFGLLPRGNSGTRKLTNFLKNNQPKICYTYTSENFAYFNGVMSRVEGTMSKVKGNVSFETGETLQYT